MNKLFSGWRVVEMKYGGFIRELPEARQILSIDGSMKRSGAGMPETFH